MSKLLPENFKEIIKNSGVMSLPDNPSAKGFNAKEIKTAIQRCINILASYLEIIDNNQAYGFTALKVVTSIPEDLTDYDEGTVFLVVDGVNVTTKILINGEVVDSVDRVSVFSGRLADVEACFDNGKAKKAIADADGNAIPTTYLKKSEVVNSDSSTSTSQPVSAYQVKLLKDAVTAIQTLLQSNDSDLDTLQEIVTYIKSNKSLIEAITTSKVSVTDIVDNLTSEVSDKPVSAKQAYILKGLIDALTAVVNQDLVAVAALSAVYSPSLTYEAGDLVVYNNHLYECKSNIISPEEWTASHWEQTTFAEKFNSLRDAIVANTVMADLDVADVPTFARFLGLGGGKGLFSIGKQFLVPKETAVNITTTNNSLTVSVDEDTFIEAEHTAQGHIYEFTYDGAVWHDEHSETVTLATYGITCTGTPAEGDKIVVTETASNMAFDLVQYDPEDYEYPYDTTKKGNYAMLLANKIHSYGSVPFCPAKLLCYFEQAVTSGNGYFKFTLKNATYGGNSQYDGTYVFYYPSAIPAYGGLQLTNGIGGYKSSYAKTDVTSANVKIFGAKYNAASHPNTFAGRGTHIKPTEITTSETRPSIVEYDAGNQNHVDAYDLGQFTAKDIAYFTEYEKDGNDNVILKRGRTQHQAYGDNRFSKSLFLAFANGTAKGSSSGLGSWYFHRDELDLCPSDSVLAMAGYLHGYGQDFLDSIQTVKVKCALPAYYTGAATYEDVECKIFLPSYTEITGNNATTGVAEGALLDWFKIFTGSDNRKKKSGSSYQYWFLRSAYSGYAHYVWGVNPSGDLSYLTAYYTNGFVPACIIKKSA